MKNKKWVLARPAYIEKSVVFLDPATGRSTRREPLNGSWRIVENNNSGYPAREAIALHAALCRQDHLLVVLELALKQ